MKSITFKWLFSSCALLASVMTMAHADNTPAGLWATLDDVSGKAKSTVRIVEHHGVLQGRIEKLLDPDDPADAICELCSDERRNQPIAGLLIMRNVTRAAGHPGLWENGDILDPENGKVYRVRLQLSPDNRKLEVRGYIGLPMLGRSQNWMRLE